MQPCTLVIRGSIHKLAVIGVAGPVCCSTHEACSGKPGVQVTGRVDKKSRKLLPPCPCDAGVVVELRLSTHFSTNRKVKLKMQPAEQDVESLKGKMASIDITSELQRAVLMAACCLNSGDTATRQRGLNVLALIDSVEQ